jgi:hypothetical protein
MSHKWATRVRGVSVCGRNVYVTDIGCRLGYQGPHVPTDAFLADLRPDLADQIRTAIPFIVAHHEARAAERAEALAAQPQTAQDTVNSMFGYADDAGKPWGGDSTNALVDPPEDDEDSGEWEDDEEFDEDSDS